MNLTDLREELTAHADDLGPAPDLRAGVAAKVRATKRRRAATAGAGAALAVAALAVGVMASVGRPAPTVPAGTPSSAAPMIGADGMPFRPVPDAPGDVTKDGLRLRARVGDDRLVAGLVGDRGQSRLSLAWEPTTTHDSVGAECYLPTLPDDQARKYMVSMGIEGAQGSFGTQCGSRRPSERDLPAGGGIPGEPGQGWSELTVGRTARVSVQLVDAKTHQPVVVEGAQLTGAVYELGTQRLVLDEAGNAVVALPEVIEQHGYRYRLTALTAGPLAAGALPELGPPTAGAPRGGIPDGPFFVSWGSAGKDLTGVDVPGSTLSLRGPKETVSRGFGAWGLMPVPAGSAPTLRLTAEGHRPDHGVAFIVVYTLVA
jgi:hypothetical protein